MGRVWIAFRAFFAALFSGATATRLKLALNNQPALAPAPEAPIPKPASIAPPPKPKPAQSEAITLLATLQREARLVDFLKEDLSGYSDDQIGAAVRDIHRDSGAVLDRIFAIGPILNEDEGASVQVPAAFDAARYRLTGKLTGMAPFQGTLRHHGWQVTQCSLPEFTGSESAAKTIMPAEVELQ